MEDAEPYLREQAIQAVVYGFGESIRQTAEADGYDKSLIDHLLKRYLEGATAGMTGQFDLDDFKGQDGPDI